jgi:hypothetical protein
MTFYREERDRDRHTETEKEQRLALFDRRDSFVDVPPILRVPSTEVFDIWPCALNFFFAALLLVCELLGVALYAFLLLRIKTTASFNFFWSFFNMDWKNEIGDYIVNQRDFKDYTWFSGL